MGEKKVHIDIEVIDAPLDYNILLGRSFMYAMKAIAYSILQIFMLLLDGKVITIDQLTFYRPRSAEALENVLPHLSGSPAQPPLVSSCPIIFKYSLLLGIYEGSFPTIPLDYTPLVCTLSTAP